MNVKRFTRYALMVQLKFGLEHNVVVPRQWPQAVRQSHKSRIESPIDGPWTRIAATDVYKGWPVCLGCPDDIIHPSGILFRNW